MDKQVDQTTEENEEMTDLGNPTWFQEQVNEVAKEISKSAVTQLSLKIPTLDVRLIQYFQQERAVQISASLLTNRMLQYILESLHGLANTSRLGSSYIFDSLIDEETGKIDLHNMLSDTEKRQMITEVLNVLQMELSQIIQQQQEMQKQQSGIQQNTGGNIIF